MTYFGVDHPRVHRSGWERLLQAKLSACELAIFAGGVLLVALVGLAAGGSLGI